MATTGSITEAGVLTGGPGGTTDTINTSQTFTAGVMQTQSIALSSGANTITIPTGTTRMWVIGPNAINPQPNPSYSGTLTWKGVAGDTGTPFSATYGKRESWDSVVAAPATVVINASVATTITVKFW